MSDRESRASGMRIFGNLFILELANNHWGSRERGLRIIREFGAIVRHNNVKAAIKLQFRDVDQFIHPEFAGSQDIRYISKTEQTRLSKEDLAALVDEIRNVGCIPMATPFDEASVDLCVEFDFPLIKIASSDVNDWPLLEAVAATRKPVIVSTGGASEQNLDQLVAFFERREIPLALNHCVSLYPSQDDELELNQIDYLRSRYPDHVIGLSTHEFQDWTSSMLISYAKGARTWERHIDIDADGIPVSPYCTLPEQADTWFKAFHKAQEMCGGSDTERRVLPKREIEYLDALVRGIYAKRPLEPGYVLGKHSFEEDFYMAIPLRKGQLSVREIINGITLTAGIDAHQPLTIDHIDGPYSSNPTLRDLIMNRGF
ncbi:MAG: N-acetylneuraminate synthase family protein [Actinomycetota bacterium]|nr:N-acetylneuraminate synthase family protein [Actinomycetota bacterium]